MPLPDDPETLPLPKRWPRHVRSGLRAESTPYTATVRRRCRCLDCGQVRIDKEYT